MNRREWESLEIDQQKALEQIDVHIPPPTHRTTTVTSHHIQNLTKNRLYT